jgi:GNAT superfamily N-acetyltransferase
MKFQINNEVDQNAYNEIVDLLVEYNSSKLGNNKEYINKPVEILVRDENDLLIGGLYGRSIWATLEIKTFVVRFDRRGQGIGQQLLEQAEQEAHNRGCRFISLDTFSFQAPEFYEKNGFKKIGVETDFPKGFCKYYYRKELEPDKIQIENY